MKEINIFTFELTNFKLRRFIKSYHSIVGKTFYCVLALLLISGKTYKQCSHGSVPKKQAIHALNVNYILPLVEWDSSITKINSSYNVYYYQNLKMYQFSYNYDSTVNGKLMLREKRYYYFVLDIDSLYGYSYYANQNHLGSDGRLSADSMFEKNTFRNNNIDTLINFKCDTTFFDSKQDFIKVYGPPISEEYPEKFTMYLHYSKKLNGVKEFFSRKMDTEKEYKLFKVVIVASGFYYKQFKMNFPMREISYEMKEIPVDNPEEILSYFNRYKKEHLKN